MCVLEKEKEHIGPSMNPNPPSLGSQALEDSQSPRRLTIAIENKLIQVNK
jgi:hypothetical protein